MEIFAYGSLIVPDVWEAVTGKKHRCEPGTIDGFVRRTIAGATFPGIVRSGDYSDSVAGAIYYDVDADSLAALDEFESDFYVRGSVVAREETGARVECEAYIVTAENAHLLSASEWDLDRFVANDLREFLARNFG